jgi:ribosomal protein S20
MTKSKILIGLLALTLVIGVNILIAIFIYPGLVFADGGRGWFNQMGLGGGISSRETRLAAALGLTVAELQTAQEAARTAAIQQAVDQGLITQSQADRMLLWGWLGFGGHGDYFDQGGLHFGNLRSGPINYRALLAQALNISEAELQAAEQKAQIAGVQEALEAGLITPAQADQMQARIRLKSYLNREVMLAEALGMRVEDLRTALSEGKTITTLLNAQNIEAVTVRQALMKAYQAAIQKAVADGVITPAQADQILSRGFNFFGRDGFEGGHPNGGEGGRKFERRGPGGRGGEWGMPGDDADFFKNGWPIAPFAAPGDTI